MKYDYGIPERGLSNDKRYIGDPFEKLVGKVDYLYFDEFFGRLGELQCRALSIAESGNYDLIFFLQFRNEFTHDTLDKIRKRTTTVAWFGDDQWRFEDYTQHYAPHFTFSCTTDPWSVAKYKALGITPILTQWAGATLTDNVGPLSESEKYEYEISFIGQENPFRAWFVRQLGQKGIPVECFGPGWPNGRISCERMEQVFRKSRINLNVSNSVSCDYRFVFGGLRNFRNFVRSPKRVEQPKGRNFEIPLAGGFQLSNYYPGLETYFRIGEEIQVYSSVEDCIKQIEWYRDCESRRKQIEINGYRRAAGEHTFYHRFAAVLQHIWR